LYKYDSKTLQKTTKPPARDKKKKPELLRDVYKTYNLIYVIAKDEDSFEQISNDTGFKVKDLIKYNEVPEDFPLRKGDVIYLQKKKSKADKPHFEHLVTIGESMHSISQRYGIQLKSLYKMNKKKPDYVPTEGDVLRLR
jgi:LysM repeat protein